MPVFSFHNLFDEIVALLLVATLAGVLAGRLRQPLLVGFIAVGIIAGPSGLNWLRSVDQIHALAQMGLALLLFIVGLKLDVRLVRSMGKVVLATGLGQVVFTTIGGFAIAYWLGMRPVTALYVAIALTFSSTVIIVKLLSDKRETDSLYGRIVLGLLIVQDIVVVLVMTAVSAVSGNQSQHPTVQALLIAGKGVTLLVGTWVVGFVIMPRLLATLAKSAELLLLFGIAWALALAGIAEVLGFSKEIGAFLAGVSLASTPYRENLGTRLASLRDFLLLFFFIELGSRLDLSSLGSQVWSAIPLSLFVLVGNPLIMMIIMGVLGYRKRTGFVAGVTIAQISEFSLILIAMAAKSGHVGDDAVGVVTLVGLVTITLSTYMILFSDQMYNRLARYLGIFERRTLDREDSTAAAHQPTGAADVVIVGLGTYGTGIAEQLRQRGRGVIGVDFDPQAVRAFDESGGQAVFGDAKDPDIAAALHLGGIGWVISSIREEKTNEALVKSIRQTGYRGRIAAAAYSRADATDILTAGANLVFNPFEDAAVQAADLIFSTEEQIARKAMDKYIESLSEHYIVCGYGRMGQQIVKDLARYEVPCVVVESNPEQLPKLKEQNLPHVEGKASEDEALLKAGVMRAKGLIAVASSDEENVFIVLTAKVLNPSLFIVARSILEENEDKLRRAGASRVMSPYILGGRRMAAAVIKPEVMDFLDLVVHSEDIDTEMASITVPAGSTCIGKTLREIDPWGRCGVTLLAIRRQGEGLHPNPHPELVVQEDDEMIAMGSCDELQAARELVSSAE